MARDDVRGHFHSDKGHKESGRGMPASDQKKDQSRMIESMRKDVMRAEPPHMPFVNKGAPSHGVTEGPDMKNADPVRKVEACGRAYKGYDDLAWKY